MKLLRISVNGKTVECHIERKKVKNINIRIKEDGVVYISANKRVPEAEIERIIMSKASFILSALENINRKKSLQLNNSIVLYLGKKYSMNFIEDKTEYVDFVHDKFVIHSNSDDNDRKRIILKKWYLSQAVKLYAEINEYTYRKFMEKGYKIPLAVVTVREMKTRWGSCNAVKGRISMNLRLMEYPVECIYGVFFHEYTHFIYQNHSKDFYSLLKMMYPDYTKTDHLLKNFKNNL